jgi:hypothetical protein
MRTDPDAVAATQAAVLEEDQVRFLTASFRIVAPPAREWTTLEEDGSPDTGTVVHGVAPDVKKKAHTRLRRSTLGLCPLF